MPDKSAHRGLQAELLAKHTFECSCVTCERFVQSAMCSFVMMFCQSLMFCRCCGCLVNVCGLFVGVLWMRCRGLMFCGLGSQAIINLQCHKQTALQHTCAVKRTACATTMQWLPPASHLGKAQESNGIPTYNLCHKLRLLHCKNVH